MSRTNASQPLSDRGHGNEAREVRIPPIGLAGILQVPKDAYALVVFAHGSGSSRLSPRNMLVARALNDRGYRDALVRSFNAGGGNRSRQCIQHSPAGEPSC